MPQEDLEEEEEDDDLPLVSVSPTSRISATSPPQPPCERSRPPPRISKMSPRRLSLSLAESLSQVSCDWWRAGHVTWILTSDWRSWTWHPSSPASGARCPRCPS